MEEMDEIRNVLIEIRMNDGFLDLRNRRGLDPNFLHRVLLLNNERLLEGAVEVVLKDGSRDLEREVLVQMTDLGHEFHDAVRDPEDWERVKEALRAAGQDLDTVALAVVIATAIKMKKGDS